MTSIIKVDNIHNSSGTSAMTIDSSGRVLQPEKPAFFLQGTSDANKTFADDDVFGATDDGQVAFSTTADGAFLQHFTYNSATGEITPLVDGVYFIAGCFFHNETSSVRIKLNVNGVRRAMGHHDSPQVKTIHISCVLNLTTSDKITFANNSGSNKVFYEGGEHTYVYGHLVG